MLSLLIFYLQADIIIYSKKIKTNMLKTTQWKLKTGLFVFGTLLISLAVAVTDMNTMLYKANILSYPEHEPFNGTVYPVKKYPNWSKLSAEERDLPYSSLSESGFVDVFPYDPDQLLISADTLKWNDPNDDIVRNAKITYSVPYLGSYKLDGKEGTGSHPAVDIKIVEGTPVFAIANGTVVKASTQTTGFGNHIVLQHNNFPTLDDPNAKTIIYSSYSHLSGVLVSVGDVVRKGDQIGLSGTTGTSTTPHLHFQIDNDQAPWHPFWPFTWKELNEAGIDFYTGVDTGFMQENARATTISPLKYVQEYLNAETTPVIEVETVADTETPPVNIEETPVATETPTITEDVIVASSDDNVITPDTVATGVETDVPENTEASGGFSDVPGNHPYYEAITYLSQEGIISGYKDVTFKPDQFVNRVEALKFILESIKVAIEKGTLPFTDVSEDEWYSKYLFTGYKMEIVDGNPDGTFRPNDTVNRAEFFKILFNGLKVDVDPTVTTQPFEDVNVDDWFAPYIQYAKKIGLLDTGLSRINPSAGMTRGEVADAMYKLINIVKL
ncbi:hypothetical protein A3B60_00335 [Candidatus Peregrinibacteria bacterium RIFCSPLOWO2_01_FULL_39_12]|nr:MAG: hypothetical protein A3B60_00335 [Candidatus Peregrinibacteria bacterium RIFCSPLOWO2_01_FULL_39_12]